MSLTSDEILSQPAAWRRARTLADTATNGVLTPGERVLILGCGTSAFIAQSIAELREHAGLGYTDAAYASEPWTWRDYDRVVLLTRSGTTTEMLLALDRIPPSATTVVITAVPTGPIVDATQHSIVLDFADEASIVQTRFPTSVIAMIRAGLGHDIDALADRLDQVLAQPLPFDAASVEHVVYLGTGFGYGLAQEAALKVREAAQAWSESYPLLDYRHGPIAVAHPGTLVWMLSGDMPPLADDISSTGAHVHVAQHDPLIELVQAQRLAVELARARGLDPDHPRHLTRAVVLE